MILPGVVRRKLADADDLYTARHPTAGSGRMVHRKVAGADDLDTVTVLAAMRQQALAGCWGLVRRKPAGATEA